MSGRVLIPATWNGTNGVPSVEAIAIPPWFAVVSVGSGSPVVPIPRIRSLSWIFKFVTLMIVSVPLTVKSPSITTLLWKVAELSYTSKFV